MRRKVKIKLRLNCGNVRAFESWIGKSTSVRVPLFPPHKPVIESKDRFLGDYLESLRLIQPDVLVDFGLKVSRNAVLIGLLEKRSQ